MGGPLDIAEKAVRLRDDVRAFLGAKYSPTINPFIAVVRGEMEAKSNNNPLDVAMTLAKDAPDGAKRLFIVAAVEVADAAPAPNGGE